MNKLKQVILGISAVVISILLLYMTLDSKVFKTLTAKQGISGEVKTLKGLPIENVEIESHKFIYTTTDKKGYFQLENKGNPSWLDTKKNILYFYKPGYKPIIKILDENTKDIEEILVEQSKPEEVIPTCLVGSDVKNLVGWSLKFKIPPGFQFDKGFDVHAGYFSVSVVKNKNQYRLEGIYGFHATSGYPFERWIIESEMLDFKLWKRGEYFVKDINGTLENGNCWRNFGYGGEAVHYYDVPKDIAFEFDKIIDSVCYSSK